MENSDALAGLNSEAPDERLRVARRLSQDATPQDVPRIQAALLKEIDPWVKGALRKALKSLSPIGSSEQTEFTSVDEESGLNDQIRSEATLEITRKLLHEIRPMVGRLKVWAKSEIAAYGESKTMKEVEYLEGFLRVMGQLSKAAEAPSLQEFDFATLIEELVASVDSEVKVELIGPKPFSIYSSKELLALIISNATRNAIEASSDSMGQKSIIITWGVTDRDYWVTVLDDGKGLPKGVQNIFEMGSTNKRDHHGMGLALGQQAARSLNGKIVLTNRSPVGAKFELRWPKLR